jgi:peptide/nickel transport system ATP-binding protein
MLDGELLMSILEAKNLSKQFQLSASAFSAARTITAVDSVSITLQQGETLGLAGESGCGKSTVARLMMGLLPPTSGELFFNGNSLSGISRKAETDFRKAVQMVFQDPYSSLNPRMRIGEIIAEPIIIHRLADRKDIREIVLGIMNRVGLQSGHYVRYPHEFSGGQRQRIGIARALAVNPGVIIADEPLSALDISIQAQIINLFIDLQKSLGLSYLIISHDLAVIRHLSTRVVIMYLGRIVEQGETEDLFTSPLHPYTEALIAAIPGLGNSREKAAAALQGDMPSPISPPSGCHFHPRCPYRREICSVHSPPLEEKKTGHLAACHFSRELFMA